MFKCDRCSYSSKNKNHLEDHQNVVHEGVIIRCPVEGCSSRFTNRSNINDHIKRIHDKETFKCQECSYVARTQRVLRVHFGLRHGVKYFACEFCDFKAGFQFVISRHTRKKHAGELTADQQKNLNIQTCQNCGFKSNKSKITEHLKDGCNRDSYHKKGKGKRNKRESRTSNKGKGKGPVLEQSKPQVKTEEVQEYYEETISPIKTEKVCDPQTDTEDISGDEDDTVMVHNGISLKIKTEQFQYLCPISSCTFTTLGETVRLLHLKSSHGLSKDLPFLKMVL